MTKALMETVKQIEDKVGKDWINQVSEIKTTEELQKQAEKWGVELSDEMALEALSLLSSEQVGEMSEEELKAAAGGCKGIIL
ncbi:MAG: hypothetical protein ACLFQE_01475 [Thermotogota bacterium]